MRSKKPSSLSFEQRLTVSFNEASDWTGLGRNSLYAMAKRGEIKTSRAGARNLIVTKTLLAKVNGQEAA